MGKPTQAQMRFCLSCSVGLSEQVRGLHTLADQFSHARIGFGQDRVDEAEEGLMVDGGEKFFDVGLDSVLVAFRERRLYLLDSHLARASLAVAQSGGLEESIERLIDQFQEAQVDNQVAQVALFDDSGSAVRFGHGEGLGRFRLV